MMFGKRPKTDAPLEQGDRLNAKLAERAEVLDTRLQLEANLAAAEARLEAIPAERQALNDERWRNQVQREVDPSRPDRSEEIQQRLNALTAEEIHLKGKSRAYCDEIGPLERRENDLRDQISRAKREAWAEMAERLLATFTPELRERFLEVWVALEYVSPHTTGQTVLQRLDLGGPMEVAVRLPVLERLRTRFELPEC